MELPLISFSLPTYNEERNIERCLKSIFCQDYLKDKIEVIIVDDDSSDRTLEICGRYPVHILHNPSGSAEVGWAMGVQAARGEFVVLLSADNELACHDWIRKMVKPVLEDREIVGMHCPMMAPRTDPAINRYYALLNAMPLEFYFMGLLRPPKQVIARDGYSLQVFGEDSLWAMGGNGTLFRKDAVLKVGNMPAQPGGDVDLVYRLVKDGFTKYAYVPEAGVYHYCIQSYRGFIKKQRLRSRYFLQYQREYPWIPSQRNEFFKMLKWILFCSTFVGPFIHAFRMRKKGDPAWLYHPLACFTAVAFYGTAFLTSREGLGLLLRMVRALAKGN